MKIILPGGRGYIGRQLARHFLLQNAEVVVLTRQSGRTGKGAYRVVMWDGRTSGAWQEELEGADLVLNLAGRSVNCRYHARNRAEIYASRLDSTRVLGKAIAQCSNPPLVWINASTATIYRHAEDRAMDEETGEIGKGFSVDVARQWELAFHAASTPRTRKVALRMAMVMGPGRGGVFHAFDVLVRAGLGGSIGPGTQYMSWVHQADLFRLLEWIQARPELTGVLNACAPYPLRMWEFMRELRNVRGVRFGLPSTRGMLEIGAFFLRTETELLLKSRRVVPGRLLDSGFKFRFPRFREAARQITGQVLGRAPSPMVQ